MMIGDDYKTGCLLNYTHFENDYKTIAIDLCKQQPLNTDLKAIQKINFTGNVDRTRDTTMFFTIEEVKETISDFPKVTLRVL